MKKLLVVSMLFTTVAFAQNQERGTESSPPPSQTMDPNTGSATQDPVPTSTADQTMNVPLAKTPPAPAPKSSSKSSKSSNQNSGTIIQDDRIKMDAKGKIQLDFVNAEISDLAQSIGELTKRNFIIDDKVRGTITIISPQPVTIDEAYAAFISALEVKGFAVLKVGQMNKIVPLREMNKLSIPTDVAGAAGGDDAFVTRLIPVQNTRSSDIAKTLRNLLTKNGDMISYDATNTLIVTDSVSNLRRLVKIIERLDQAGLDANINILKLQYAPAVDTAEKVKKIFDLGGSTSSAGPDGASVTYSSKIFPDERTNSLIIVSSQEAFTKIAAFVKKIDNSLGDQIGSGRIHVHYLNYADSKELAATLAGVSAGAAKRNQPTGSSSNNRRNAPQQPQPDASGGAPVVAGLLGGDVEVVADEETNALIITASSNDYQSLIPVINKLDTRRPQAFVEAMILEVDVNKATDIGVSGNLGTYWGGDRPTQVFGATTFGTLSSINPSISGNSLQGLVVGTRSRTFNVPLGGGNSLEVPIFGGLFRALQTSGVVNVLSTPNILTRDNKEAEIIVGSKVPFISSQGRDINNQPINQIQREDVALTLRVKPQINSSDEMTLDIFQEIQDIISNSDIYGPTTSKRSAKTTVLVKNGQTITIGGLISDRVSDQKSKVPLLGDIPLLGWLFRSSSTEKKRMSLMIFLTPSIIRSPEDLETISLDKNYERTQFIRKNHTEENPAILNYGLNKDMKAPVNKPTPPDSPTSGFLSDQPKK